MDFEKHEEGGEAGGNKETAPGDQSSEKDGDEADSTDAEGSLETADEERDPAVGELELERGLDRCAWDLRAADAKEFEGIILWAGDTEGPVVPPGAYSVTLTVGDESVSAD